MRKLIGKLYLGGILWERYLFAPKDPEVSWTQVIKCRLLGHPAGVVWYDHGSEPDYHCRNCFDDLG